MTRLRALGLLALVAAAAAAPVEHQVAGRSAAEDQLTAASLVWPGAASTSPAAEEGTSSQPEHVRVSVSTSTSVEITTVTSSVSSEMEPLPEAAGRPEDSQLPEAAAEEAPGVELEAGQAELQKATQQEQGEEGESEEALKSVAEEVAAYASTTVAATELGGSSEEGGSDSAEQTTAVSQTSPAATATVGAERATESPQMEAENVTESRQAEAENATEPRQAEAENVTESRQAEAENATESRLSEEGGAGTEAAQGSSEPTATNTTSESSEDASGDVSSTKGTLIFDLGPSASAELHDLVQQTVLDALMDEGLLSAAAVAAATPVIEAEGSGIVFVDDAGSGGGEAERDVGQGRSSPFVSIHF